MPIIDCAFDHSLFSCKEVGVISGEDATDWGDQLKRHARESKTPIVALVDALSVEQILPVALDIFAKASFTQNVKAVVVATNATQSVTSRNIGLLGKRNRTLVCGTLQEARNTALGLLN